MISGGTEPGVSSVFIESSLWLECFREGMLVTSRGDSTNNWTDEYENGGHRIGEQR
jgi:hypothetical protein